MARSDALFAVEGGMFPGDLIEEISAGSAAGQDGKSFGLESGRRLTDEIQRSFSDARAEWEAYQRRLSRSRQSRTSLTRQYWAVPFLENLGFYEIQPQRAHLEAGPERYEISHLSGVDEGAVPIHVVGGDRSLEERIGRRTAHAQVQEYLNRSDALWGLVTNGERLRLLRDSERFTRPTYVEFDLRGIFEGNQYREFALCYRMLHRTRFPAGLDLAADSWLERYFLQGIEQGGRVRDRLRVGVERAIAAIGQGLLAHPESGSLRDEVASGRLPARGYYRQLLSLVYRILFLLVAEERRLIRPVGDAAARFDAYLRNYSISALRERCQHYFAGDKNHDCWLGLLQTFAVFGESRSAAHFGLAALDGDLFGKSACPDIERALISNEALLAAVWEITTFPEGGAGGVRRRVNFAGLDVEELGSVYESLLDLEPMISVPGTPGGAPAFALAHSSQRKQTGSYYTPPDLVRELVNSALVPVIAQRMEDASDRSTKEQALLSLRVVDPACGSGHFLLAAARRIATDLAQVRAGEDGATPSQYRHALREVIASCIYGVDKNPLAVDLCKVALWIEGHDPGKALSFLDHHIRCGDSLVGIFDLAVLESGIPDGAFKPLDGDEKQIALDLRKRNRGERKGLQAIRSLAEESPDWGEEFGRHSRLPSDDPGQVETAKSVYQHLRRPDSSWGRAKLACDLWMLAFFSSFASGEMSPPTTDVIRQFRTGVEVGPNLGQLAESASDRYRFFHWPLEFPEVFAAGGFDVVLGNPPWERVTLSEKEFFAGRDEEIARAPNKAARGKLIGSLAESSPGLHAAFLESKRDAERLSRFLRGSGRFPLTGRGDINTYSVFVETGRSLIRPQGRAGLICPSGIATDNTTRRFFADLIESKSLATLLDFENRDGVFAGVHRSFKFCLLTIAGAAWPNEEAEFAFYLRQTADLKDGERRFALGAEDFELFNPNTRTAPTFRTHRDAEIARRMYERAGVFVREGSGGGQSVGSAVPDAVSHGDRFAPVSYPEGVGGRGLSTRGQRVRAAFNPWGVRFNRMFDMAADSEQFRTRQQLEESGFDLEGNEYSNGTERYLPLYEAKLFHQFDHRFATFVEADEKDLRSGNARDMTDEEKSDPDSIVIPRYWVPESAVVERLGRGRKPVEESSGPYLVKDSRTAGQPDSPLSILADLAFNWCRAASPTQRTPEPGCSQ